jgi:hypothetical protein
MSLEHKPVRPQRVPRKKPNPPKKESNFDPSEVANPTSFETNKYAPKEKIGKPSVGVPSGKVEKVGLNGLKVITNYGNTNV